MFELRIAGATPHELMSRLNDVANALLLLSAPDARPAEDPFPASDDVGMDKLVEEFATSGPNPSVSAQPAKRGRKPKVPPVTIDADPVPPAEPLQTADFLDDASAATPVYTEADCREAVKLSLENYADRARAAGEKNEARIMADKVAWTKPLLAEFKVGKVSDLKLEQYAAFMAAATPYIDGTKGA